MDKSVLGIVCAHGLQSMYVFMCECLISECERVSLVISI